MARRVLLTESTDPQLPSAVISATAATSGSVITGVATDKFITPAALATAMPSLPGIISLQDQIDEPSLCQVRMSSAQSISNNSVTALSFDTEDLDVHTWHAGGSPTLVTPTVAGWYQATVVYEWQSDGDYTRRYVEIQKNTASLTPLTRADIGSSNVPTGILSASLTSPLIQMNGSSDTIRATAFQTNTSTGANTVNAVLLVRLVYRT